ncbi:MAG TPA: choice-of-anchor tandem repeat GloVer-containing protein [Hanamia sp.]
MKINKYLVIILILLSCKKATNLTNTSTNQNNGNNPLATDTIGHSIQFWGMNLSGGLNDSGTIFKINGDGSGYADVYSFSSSSGNSPLNGGFCKAPNGKLYGKTDFGGLYHSGTIFSIDPGTNTFKKLFELNSLLSNPLNLMSGANESSLLLASDNNIYGTTVNTLFKIDPSNDNISIVHNFDSLKGGFGPLGGRLFQGNDNKLYGMCELGGWSWLAGGTIFSFDLLNSDFKVIYQFDLGSGTTDGIPWDPFGSLYQATDNNFYGFSYFGGGDSCDLFRLNSIGTAFTVVKIFDNLVDLSTGVIQANNKLYGLFTNGGPNYIVGQTGAGILFSYDLGSNSYNIEHAFGGNLGQNITDGVTPVGTLTKASNNLLYSVTRGGPNGTGTIFRFDPASSSYKIIYSFPALTSKQGFYPQNLTEY